MDTAKQAKAMERLRDVLSAMKQSQLWNDIVEQRDQVFSRFQPIFTATHLSKLTAEEFKPSLFRHESSLDGPSSPGLAARRGHAEIAERACRIA